MATHVPAQVPPLSRPMVQPRMAPQQALEQMGSKKSSRFIMIVAFLSGLGLMINVRLGVRLSLTELFAPFIFIALSSRISTLLALPTTRILLTLATLNVIGITLSDVLNDVPFSDMIRSIAKPVFIVMLFINFGLLFIQDIKYIVPICFGFAISAILHLIFNTGDDLYDFTHENAKYAFFVFRIAPVVSLGVGLIGFYFWRVHRYLALIPMLAGVGVTAFLLSRSALVVWICSFMAIVYAVRNTPIDWRSVLNPRGKIIAVFVVSTATVFLCYFAYKQLAYSGLLPETNKHKINLKQLENGIGCGPIGLLMVGRSEVVASALMVYDRPFLGHGSSSFAGKYYIQAQRLANERQVYDPFTSRRLYARVSTGHSVLMHSWACHGILGAPLWIYVAFRLFYCLTVMLLAKSPYTPLVVLQLITIFWDLLFSPLSVQTRAWIPLLLAFFAFYLPQLQNEAHRQLGQVRRTVFNRQPVPSRLARAGL